VTNVTFSFETSPNTNPKRKMWGDMAYHITPYKKVAGHVPRVPRQIAPMFISMQYKKLQGGQIHKI